MKKIALLILYLIPVALLIWFVASFSVNVPVHDQWRLVNLFDKIAGGNVSFGEFWALHSNHRIIFPKIIISILAFSSQWNINYELILSIFFAIASFILIYKLSANQVRNKGDNLFHLTNILTGFWVFALVQHENWLWGFQLAWFLVNLCVIIAIFVLSLETIWGDSRLFIAAICCEVASFSSAQGLLSWLALIPVVIAVKGEFLQIRKRLGLWIFLFLLTAALYSIDYHPKREMSMISLWEKPLVVVNYFFNILGSPIVRYPGFSGVLGLVILLVFLFFLFYFYSKNVAIQEQAAPWLSLGFFSVLSAVFITVGRARFGANHAIDSSRYTTVSICLLIAILQLCLLFIRSDSQEKKFISKLVYRFFAGVLICVIWVNSQQAIAQAKSALVYRKSAGDCLELIHYLDGNFFDNSPDSCLWVMTEKTQVVREGAEVLDRLGFRKIAGNIAFIDRPNTVYGYLDNPQLTTKSLIVKKGDSLRVSGWAIFPDSQKQPNIVLLSYGKNQSFFANAYVNLDSDDVAKALKSDKYNQARWGVTFSANFLPIGETIINVWVYNPSDRLFVKLDGGAKVTVEK
ncbi:hypothetical protein BCD67_18235 [Oscillatoriales cyanobacterium USR001]|nr:hypothetical protein BCD67_18235 [Oscillatoriales cyanobacterium USR001]